MDVEIAEKEIGVSINRGTPKSSILMRFSLVNHLFWGIPNYGTPKYFLSKQSKFLDIFGPRPWRLELKVHSPDETEEIQEVLEIAVSWRLNMGISERLHKGFMEKRIVQQATNDDFVAWNLEASK